jgi:uncharacterized Zn finger protein
MAYYNYFGWKPYVSAAQRQRKAEREMQKLKRKGHTVSPVLIEGRKIAHTFWGKAWCENLERYSDFSNRLPRGRTYVRNGSVVDLQIAPGRVDAKVSGSHLYTVSIKVSAVPAAQWASICADCAGGIDSLVELLQGRFSQNVMERICREQTGLFPPPHKIQFSCSCPDWASMCKHVAAVLYGIGARLDHQPEFLFRLRKVDEKDLIAGASKELPFSTKKPVESRLLASNDLSKLFGLDMAATGETPKSARGKGLQKVRARRWTTAHASPKTVSPKKPTRRRSGGIRKKARTQRKNKK